MADCGSSSSKLMVHGRRRWMRAKREQDLPPTHNGLRADHQRELRATSYRKFCVGLCFLPPMPTTTTGGLSSLATKTPRSRAATVERLFREPFAETALEKKRRRLVAGRSLQAATTMTRDSTTTVLHPTPYQHERSLSRHTYTNIATPTIIDNSTSTTRLPAPRPPPWHPPRLPSCGYHQLVYRHHPRQSPPPTTS